MTEESRFVMERQFKAPPALVWRAWTEPELLQRWYGPGVETIIHAFELKPGGLWLNEMRKGDWSDYSRMTFRVIEPNQRLEWLHTSTDANWAPSPNQMMPDWPRTLLTTVTFEGSRDKTMVTLTWSPHEASASERACFDTAKEQFGGGWGSGYAIIDEILAELQTDTK